MKYFEKIQKILENFKSVLAVVEAGPSLLEFFRVSGGGDVPPVPPGAATGAPLP